MAGLMKRLSLKGSGPSSEAQKNFTANLKPEAIAYFNEVAGKPFNEQAVAFLNAYWEEVGDQAPFIFEVAWDTIKYADMHTKGISLLHMYTEGVEIDFNVALYFYECLAKRVLEDPEGKKWRDDPKYAPSMPEMMTAIVRKKELRDKVDINFDGRVSFLEYLLYQYRHVTNPAEFTRRAMASTGTKEHPKVVAARIALDEVNEKIRAYEKEKARLTELAKQDGVKGLSAKHQLTMLVKSPVAEELQVALIKAEAAVRMAVKASRADGGGAGDGAGGSSPTPGTLFWMDADLKAKQKLYGNRGKK